jgi:hypothetical protein
MWYHGDMLDVPIAELLDDSVCTIWVEHQGNRFMGCDDNIETSLAYFKTTMRMEVLHGKTVPV